MCIISYILLDLIVQARIEDMVKGYLLLEKGSQVCLPQPLMDDALPYENFTVCLLLRPQGGHGRFFHYNDNNTQLTAGYHSAALSSICPLFIFWKINHNGRTWDCCNLVPDFQWNFSLTELTSWKSGRQLEVKVDGKSFTFNTSLPADLWTPICLGYSTTTQQVKPY